MNSLSTVIATTRKFDQFYQKNLCLSAEWLQDLKTRHHNRSVEQNNLAEKRAAELNEYDNWSVYGDMGKAAMAAGQLITGYALFQAGETKIAAGMMAAGGLEIARIGAHYTGGREALAAYLAPRLGVEQSKLSYYFDKGLSWTSTAVGIVSTSLQTWTNPNALKKLPWEIIGPKVLAAGTTAIETGTSLVTSYHETQVMQYSGEMQKYAALLSRYLTDARYDVEASMRRNEDVKGLILNVSHMLEMNRQVHESINH